MDRLLAQHAAPHRHRGVEGQKVKFKAKEAGGASRQHLRQPQAEGRAQRVLGYFSTRATLISGPTGAALHVASSPGCAGWLGAARAAAANFLVCRNAS